MKDEKTFGWILFVAGSIVGFPTLYLAPISMVGLYLLLGEYKPAMGKVPKSILSIIGGLVIPFLLASAVSFIPPLR